MAVVACLALTSCAQASPEAELQKKANDVVEAANAGDAAALRTAAGHMLEEVQQQSADADITSTKAQALRATLASILTKAALLDEQPSPSPSAESPSPAPSPSAESPSPSPSPSPEPSPPPPSSEPPPPSPDVLPSVEVSAAAVEQSPQGSPTPAA